MPNRKFRLKENHMSYNKEKTTMKRTTLVALVATLVAAFLALACQSKLEGEDQQVSLVFDVTCETGTGTGCANASVTAEVWTNRGDRNNDGHDEVPDFTGTLAMDSAAEGGFSIRMENLPEGGVYVVQWKDVPDGYEMIPSGPLALRVNDDGEPTVYYARLVRDEDYNQELDDLLAGQEGIQGSVDTVGDTVDNIDNNTNCLADGTCPGMGQGGAPNVQVEFPEQTGDLCVRSRDILDGSVKNNCTVTIEGFEASAPPQGVSCSGEFFAEVPIGTRYVFSKCGSQSGYVRASIKDDLNYEDIYVYPAVDDGALCIDDNVLIVDPDQPAIDAGDHLGLGANKSCNLDALSAGDLNSAIVTHLGSVTCEPGVECTDEQGLITNSGNAGDLTLTGDLSSLSPGDEVAVPVGIEAAGTSETFPLWVSLDDVINTPEPGAQ
jgi:hypothetical protein